MGKGTSSETPGTACHCLCGCGHVGGTMSYQEVACFGVASPHPGLCRLQGRCGDNLAPPCAHIPTWPWGTPYLILLVDGLWLQQEIGVPDHHHHVPELQAKRAARSGPHPLCPQAVVEARAGGHTGGHYLGPGSSPCLLVHPVQLIQALVQDVFDVLHQLLHLRQITAGAGTASSPPITLPASLQEGGRHLSKGTEGTQWLHAHRQHHLPWLC